MEANAHSRRILTISSALCSKLQPSRDHTLLLELLDAGFTLLGEGYLHLIDFYIPVSQDAPMLEQQLCEILIYSMLVVTIKNKKNTTVALCTTQFRLRIETLVSYTRNKIDFFNPKLNRKVFYRWSGNKMTVLLLIHLWLTLSSYDRYGLNVLCRFSLYDDITKRPKELCLLGSIHKATPRGFLQKRAHLILHYSYSLYVMQRKTCTIQYLYRKTALNPTTITVFYITGYSYIYPSKSSLHI